MKDLPACDGWCKNANAVTHIGEEGFVYCDPCATRRKGSGYERCRKMRAWELQLLREGKPLPSYKLDTPRESA